MGSEQSRDTFKTSFQPHLLLLTGVSIPDPECSFVSLRLVSTDILLLTGRVIWTSYSKRPISTCISYLVSLLLLSSSLLSFSMDTGLNPHI